MLNYYLVGMRVTIGNVKNAAGLYAQDQWAPVVQALINLVVSIWGAVKMGLPGVFLGTVVSSLAVPCWYRPMVVYKHAFRKPVGEYFAQYFMYMAVVFLNLALVMGINYSVIDSLVFNEYASFVLKMMVCAIVPNAVIVVLFHRTEEFSYLVSLAKALLKRLHR